MLTTGVLHEKIDTSNGEPGGKPGAKQQTVGKPSG